MLCSSEGVVRLEGGTSDYHSMHWSLSHSSLPTPGLLLTRASLFSFFVNFR